MLDGTLAQRQGRSLKRSQDSARKLRMVGADLHDEREKDDFYCTPPELTRALLRVEAFDGPIWEPACGNGAISEVLRQAGFPVVSTDLVARGYGIARRDFLLTHTLDAPTIITNPPFKLADLFWRHAIDLGADRIAFCLRLTWLEGLERAAMFADRRYRPSRVWVCPWRAKMQRGRIAEKTDRGGMLAFAWYVWSRDASPVNTALGWLPDTRTAA